MLVTPRPHSGQQRIGDLLYPPCWICQTWGGVMGPWTTEVQPAPAPAVPAAPAAAWSALSPDERRAAWAAARARAGIVDPRVAVAALTYGQRLAGTLTVVRVVWPAAAMVTLVPLAILGFALKWLGVPSFPLYLGLALILPAAFVMGLRILLALRALASAGRLGLEMAQLRAARSGGRWPASAAVGGPAQPGLSPAFRGADPGAPDPGPQPLTIAAISPSAGRARAALAILVGVAALTAVTTAPVTTPGDWISAVMLGVFLVGFTWLYGRTLPRAVAALFMPAEARLSTDGVELDQLGTTVPWADVVGVDIRFPFLGSGLTFGATPDSVVVLRVRDPEQYRGAGRLVRWTMRANQRDYGSPLAFPAGPRTTRSLGEVLAFISSVSNAPIRYDDPASRPSPATP
jgi:hypothetical protein